MHYTLIDKNEFIPKMITGDINLLKELKKNTLNESINYCKNIYVINYGDFENIICVYISDGNKLYVVDDNGVLEYKEVKQCSKEKVFEYMHNFFSNFVENNINDKMNIEIVPMLENKNIDKNIDKNIKTTEIKNTLVDDKNKDIGITVIDNKTDNENVLDECELMYQMYLEDKERKKKLEDELKIEEKKEKELLKKKRHMIQEKIITLKGNYRTYVNIKKDVLKNVNMKIPDTFEVQYEYFEKMDENDLQMINDLDDLEIMNSENYDEDIVMLASNFCEKIGELKEKLTFTHNWSELDNEYKVGSYSVGYNK